MSIDKYTNKSIYTNNVYDEEHVRYIRETCEYKHILGEYLGCGHSRVVFVHKEDPSLVVKVEINVDEIVGATLLKCNAIEWKVWNEKEEYRPYLAPCIWISEDKSVLVMRRVDKVARDCTSDEITEEYWDLSDETDELVGDHSLGNVGLLNGKFVYIDYAQ